MDPSWLMGLIPDWWFGTFFIFHNIWDNPSHRVIFFNMVKTTNQQFRSHHPPSHQPIPGL
jgi:hypothetical protein